ncbi:MAG: hypothetical protein HC767_04075, partial [Akkermansiaceae bacterium]|nr:hypothetical protein [Akkermansiaceae bacterium]
MNGMMCTGAPRRNVTLDFRGAFYVPAVRPETAAVARNSLAAAIAAQIAPEGAVMGGDEFSGAIIDHWSAQQWLVVNPCTLMVRFSLLICKHDNMVHTVTKYTITIAGYGYAWGACMQVSLEATGAEGAAPFGAAASALLPNITVQASHWQLADMARLAHAASGVTTRMQYMHLLPLELRPVKQEQRPARTRR